MFRRISLAAALAATAALSAPAVAPAAAQELTWSGQVRPRYEYRDPFFRSGRDEFTTMRVRLGLQAVVDPALTLFVQGQEIRTWGEETSTAGDYRSDNLDLHQAWLRWAPVSAPWFRATVGRQETSLGGERLVGAVDWLQQGRSFDGVRLDLDGARADIVLLAHVLADATTPAHEADAELFGAYATVAEVGPGALDLYLLYDRREGVAPWDQTTFGTRWDGVSGSVRARVEGSLQRGDRAGAPVSAWMVGARLGVAFGEGRGSATLWYDHLSGNDPDDAANNAFSTLYATNHKYYGFADLFTDVPAHTGGRGLRDAALKLSWRAAPGTTLAADLHRFSAARDQGLESGHFADELDLTLSRALSSHLTLVGGLSRVWQAEALGAVGRLQEDMTFGYLMLNAAF